MRWPWSWRACLLLALIASPAAVRAQIDSREGIALQNQLFQLRQEVQSLRGEVARTANAGAGYGGGGDAAQVLARVQALEEQVRQLRGLIDELRNQEMRHHAEVSKRIDDLAFQMNLPSRSAAPGLAPPSPREVPPGQPPEPRRADTPRLNLPPPSGASPPPRPFTLNTVPEPVRDPAARPAPDPVRPVPPPPRPQAPAAPPAAAPPAAEAPPAAADPNGRRTPELALQEGQAALARRDYAAAERSAQEVMANRASPRGYDGQFLLAQALSGQKQFPQAAIAYDDAYNRNRKGRHAQDALLGLAGALTAINEKRAACDTLGKLNAEFPQMRADVKDQAVKAGERAGCAR